MPQMLQQMMGLAHIASITQQMTGLSDGDDWRTGDGKVLVPCWHEFNGEYARKI
jgi:hypothetical protein